MVAASIGGIVVACTTAADSPSSGKTPSAVLGAPGDRASASASPNTNDEPVTDGQAPEYDAWWVDHDGATPSPPPPDFAEVPASECGSFAADLCDFDGTCPNLAAIINGGQYYVPDAGVAGSKGMVISQPNAGFGMPYWDYEIDPRLVAVDACQVTCEADVRLGEGLGTSAIVSGSTARTWGVEIEDGGTYNVWSNRGGAVYGDLAFGNDWFHVKLHLSPLGDGGAMSQVTFTTPAGSKTTAVPIDKLDREVIFGTFGAFFTNGQGSLYVDNIRCALATP